MSWWPQPWNYLRRRRALKDSRGPARTPTLTAAAPERPRSGPWPWPVVAGLLLAVLHGVLFPPLPRLGAAGFPREGEIAAADIRTPIGFTGTVLARDVEILQIEKVLVEPPVLRRLDGAAQRSGLTRLAVFTTALAEAAAADQGSSSEALVRRLSNEFPDLDPRDIERALGAADPRRLGAVMTQVGATMAAEGVADMLPPGAYSRVAVLDGMTEIARDLAAVTQQSRLVEVLTARLRDAGLAPAEAVWAAAMLRQFVTPNLIFDAHATRANQDAARQSVPLVREFIPGERIVARGERVTEQDAVFLESLSLALATERGPTAFGERFSRMLVRATLLAVLLGLFGWLAWVHFRTVLTNPLFLGAMTATLALFLVSAAFALGRPGLGHFAVPIAFVALMPTVLFREQAGYATAVLATSLLAMLPEAPAKDLLALTCLGLVTVVTVRRIQKRSQFYQIIGVLTLLATLLVTLVRASAGLTVPEIGGEYLPAVFTPVLAVAFALFILPLVEPLVGVSSDLTLLELSDLNHPLLQRMAIEAPGTYHHSQVVSQLAEQAARAVNVNALQVRVGALFHDIGKMQKAEYYVENQSAGTRGNKHDELSPSMSALIIASHVKDGIELARRWRLPQVVIDFIPQHHGTQVMEYFYHKALEGEANETVKVDDYRYPGPKPQRRETAILMLADAVEAASRSLAKPTPARIKEVTKQVCDKRMLSGELDECNLTLADLARIREAFIPLLTGIHHARIVYPGQRERDNERLAAERRAERTLDA
jgi:putative nucleotidyltransferase with HDIG domain